jgi:hypothetical protein
MLKLVDSHDLKSCGFSRPSSSLGEATLRSKLAENKKQFVYDNVYDMISCIRHDEKKVEVVRVNSKTLDLKSVLFLECQFESGQEHHQIYDK